MRLKQTVIVFALGLFAASMTVATVGVTVFRIEANRLLEDSKKVEYATDPVGMPPTPVAAKSSIDHSPSVDTMPVPTEENTENP